MTIIQLTRKHINVPQILGALIMMIMMLTVTSLMFNQYVEARDNYHTGKLQEKEPNDFLVYYEVEPTQDEFIVGQHPDFFFTKEYFQSGIITGRNTLRCDGFRSDVFEAEGFVELDQLNILSTGKPFVFNRNLPDFPTECNLRSIITLCEAEYGVCKTVTTESSPFNYVIE